MFYPQSPLGMEPIEKADRIMTLKLGQVTELLPSVQQVKVTFDGQEQSNPYAKATGPQVNTRNLTCHVGTSVAHFRSGVAELPPLYSWVVVGFIENVNELPIVLCSIHDDLSCILPTLASDPHRRLWHHFSDITTLINGDGQMEFVHPSGLKGLIGEDSGGSPTFTRHYQQIRNDYNRGLKNLPRKPPNPDKPWLTGTSETEASQEPYTSGPDLDWGADGPTGGGAWDYGPAQSARAAGDDAGYDHRMRETAGHKAFLRLEHPSKGRAWRNAPLYSGGEFGANYQETDSWVEWNGKGDFRLHIDKFRYLEMTHDPDDATKGRIGLHMNPRTSEPDGDEELADYFLDIDSTAETVTLSAKDGEVLLTLDAANTKVMLKAKDGQTYLEMNGGTGQWINLKAKDGTEELVLSGSTGLGHLFASVDLKLGDVNATQVWKEPDATLFYNAHTHLGFLGIPTSPPVLQLVPGAGTPTGVHLTTITKAS